MRTDLVVRAPYLDHASESERRRVEHAAFPTARLAFSKRNAAGPALELGRGARPEKSCSKPEGRQQDRE